MSFCVQYLKFLKTLGKFGYADFSLLQIEVCNTLIILFYNETACRKYFDEVIYFFRKISS